MNLQILEWIVILKNKVQGRPRTASKIDIQKINRMHSYFYFNNRSIGAVGRAVRTSDSGIEGSSPTQGRYSLFCVTKIFFNFFETFLGRPWNFFFKIIVHSSIWRFKRSYTKLCEPLFENRSTLMYKLFG